MKTKLYFLVLFCFVLIHNGLNAQHKYGEVLQKSMFFFEAQQAGHLTNTNRVSWRADAAVADGKDVALDLSGGWFDAGDHVKFNFPMAYTVTTLCWGYLENKAAYQTAGQTQFFLDNIKHTTDYLIKCHSAPNELYAQIGDGNEDHKYWVPAEVIETSSIRASYKITAAQPGSDLAGETAAALAAASIVFKDSDPTYSSTLLSHAKQLYTFADTYRGKYSDIIPASPFYTSYSGYQDEIVWGAIWLYKATNQVSYLDKAKTEYENLGNESQTTVKSYGWTIAWDDKSYGCYVLMAAITGETRYNEDAERHLDQWFIESASDGKGPSFTGAGFPHLAEWGSFRYAANTAFLMLEQSDNMSNATKRDKYRLRAKEITNYLLGDNPQNTSYVIGYGSKYPLFPHHRTAHGPWSRDEKVPVETRHILYGALVGGHKKANDLDWVDNRHDYYWNEVACDYNALFTGVVARLYSDFGGAPATNFPVKETPDGEFLVEAKMNSAGNTHSEYAVWVHNRTAWAARIPKLKFRLFFNITEGLTAGYKVSDYVVSANTSNAKLSALQPQDAANGIYYVEVTFNDDVVIYPGGQGESKRESQVRVRLPYDAPATAWDPTNDWSAQGVVAGLTEVSNIPLYANGKLVFGKEPGPVIATPADGVTLSPKTTTINKGLTETLTATVSPIDASNKGVTWTSSNAAIAIVNVSGVVTAIAKGSTNIIVKTDDGGFTDTCYVTVTDIPVPTYKLVVTTVGMGKVTLSPEGGSYKQGQVVTLTATADSGNTFVSWSGDASGTATTTTITMNNNKAATATFKELGAGCSTYTKVLLPFKNDGAGEFCWEVSEDIDFINSWNMEIVEVNGVDFTNTWSNNMPPKQNGKYLVKSKSLFPWSHIEIMPKSAGKSSPLGLGEVKESQLSIFPNPADKVIVIANIANASKVSLYTLAGQLIHEKSNFSTMNIEINIGNLEKGTYLVSAQFEDGKIKSKLLLIK